jgi:hypothetical protein
MIKEIKNLEKLKIKKRNLVRKSFSVSDYELTSDND